MELFLVYSWQKNKFAVEGRFGDKDYELSAPFTTKEEAQKFLDKLIHLYNDGDPTLTEEKIMFMVKKS